MKETSELYQVLQIAHYNAGVKAAMQMYTMFDASFVVSDAQLQLTWQHIHMAELQLMTDWK